MGIDPLLSRPATCSPTPLVTEQVWEEDGRHPDRGVTVGHGHCGNGEPALKTERAPLQECEVAGRPTLHFPVADA